MNTNITVSGMTCGHCVASVTEELKKIAGVTDVNVELETGKVAITSDSALEQSAIASAIEEAGYELK